MSGRPGPPPWPAEVVEAVPRLAARVARRSPPWAREEVAGAAAMAMWEAWAAGDVSSEGGLVAVGRRAAGRARRAATFGCAERAAYGVAEAVEPPLRLDATPSLADRLPAPGGAGAEPGRLGAVLDRLVAELAARGVEAGGARLAVEAVTDRVADVGVHAVYNAGTAGLARRIGWDRRACRALVVLLLGQPRARNGGPHPGLLARAAAGEDVWADPRVALLLGEVARPSRGYVRGAWDPAA